MVAPVLWIEGDTPCHSELCGLQHPTCLYPCRKCYFLNKRAKSDVRQVTHYTGKHTERKREHFVQAALTEKRTTIINYQPEKVGSGVSAKTLNFTQRNTDMLLELNAFDPSKDTPVEILHAILLGIGKYLVGDMVKIVLKKEDVIMDKLAEKIKAYQDNSVGLSRKFTRKLKHVGSCLGRDFKILLQVLPIVLMKDFSDVDVLKRITTLFVKLGKLCSLVFIREVKERFKDYIQAVDQSVEDLIKALHDYDENCGIDGHLLRYCRKVKVHLLTHLPQDIKRFGTALHYETEKGEQLNKHIREHIQFTNKLNVSRDIGLKFAKQAIIRHVIEGGSWMNEEGLREKPGDDLISFVKEVEESIYNNLLGGSREFIDNTDPSYKKVYDGSVAVFEDSSSANERFVGVVSESIVSKASIIERKLDEGRLWVKVEDHQTIITIPLDKLKLIGVLNAYKETNDTYMINLHKFGSSWYFSNM